MGKEDHMKLFDEATFVGVTSVVLNFKAGNENAKSLLDNGGGKELVENHGVMFGNVFEGAIGTAATQFKEDHMNLFDEATNQIKKNIEKYLLHAQPDKVENLFTRWILA